MRGVILCFLLVLSALVHGQSTLHGTVADEENQPIAHVNILIKGTTKGTTTNQKGEFTLSGIDTTSTIIFHHIGYFPQEILYNPINNNPLNIILKRHTQVLTQVEVIGVLEEKREQAGVTTIEPKSVEMLPSPFSDFSKVLATLPGVVSNNELSSSYTVRGGNFAENLVCVNDIPVYRPQLVSAGRQEGLSFVNSKLVDNISFSAGGWQAKYGDKLSSSLNVDYKTPTKFASSATISLLGADAHIEDELAKGRVNYVVGVRHKRSEYLLNSLETKGQYLPRFTDVQSYININLGPEVDKSKTRIGVLAGYARNRYQVLPASKETEFGTFNQSLRLYVAFEGNELVQYDTYQGGLKLSHNFNNRITSHLIFSGVKSSEREYRDVEGAYRLCDVDNRPGSSFFNECIVTRGIGSNYRHSRNQLDISMLNAESRNEIKLNDNNTMEVGAGYGFQHMDDVLDEYTFRDSSEYIIELQSLEARNALSNNFYTAYVQNTTQFDQIILTVGVRGFYTDRNNQLLVSPRLQASYEPAGVKQDVVFRAAIGMYQQPTFYREVRDMDGELHEEVKAQSSMHYILGMDRNLRLWGRGFKFTTEAYYKQYFNIIPYDVDNVRLRYYADMQAKGYATGIDMRFSGEFIPGTVSWFSLGVLSTKEDVEGDSQGEIRRPSDQRMNLGIFFQDQLPNDPSWRVNLSLFLGTGLPFGPPNELDNRNAYIGDVYRRVDIGFVKEFYFGKDRTHSVLLGAEILNLFGADNTISYTWIEDVHNQQFAVPNSLSARFFNLKLTVRI